LAQGEKYFYNLLTDLSNIDNITSEDFIDWGNNEKYIKAIGIGECAGVVIDLIATLFLESEEKITNANSDLKEDLFSNAIYHAYSSMVNSAKAILLSEDIKTNTQSGIILQFQELFVATGKIELGVPFTDLIYQIKMHGPSREFAENYISSAQNFLQKVKEYRSEKQDNKVAL